MELRIIAGQEVCVASSALDHCNLHALIYAALQGVHVIAHQGSTETYAGILVPARNPRWLSAEGTMPVEIYMGTEPATAGCLSHAISINDEIKRMKSRCYASASAHYTVDDRGPAVILSLPDRFEMDSEFEVDFELNRELSPGPCRLAVVDYSKFMVSSSSSPIASREITLHVTTEASRSQSDPWRNLLDPHNPKAIRARAKRLMDQLHKVHATKDYATDERESHEHLIVEYATAVHEAFIWILDKYGDEGGWLPSSEKWCHGYSGEILKDLDGVASPARRRLVYNLNDDPYPAYCAWQPES